MMVFVYKYMVLLHLFFYFWMLIQDGHSPKTFMFYASILNIGCIMYYSFIKGMVSVLKKTPITLDPLRSAKDQDKDNSTF